MEYDFKTYATFGSDGGGEFYNSTPKEEIGYTDGSPYVANKWEPFKSATAPISTLKKMKKSQV